MVLTRNCNFCYLNLLQLTPEGLKHIPSARATIGNFYDHCFKTHCDAVLIRVLLTETLIWLNKHTMQEACQNEAFRALFFHAQLQDHLPMGQRKVR